ncbi:MAG: bifunctional lysylphosphatidylglycerol flippase/synthetase MprF, partial [Deltaproteobacteria bacterium]|nr:bifunctional lysylphosphatidylglycerol flippase/synthetase MprF [Deltaproteobacteria bacterium]
EWITRTGDTFSRWAAPVAPQVFALAAFAGGIILLLSGATPSLAGRLRILEWLVPLPILEASHFLGSLAGVSLLFLARGLSRRLYKAWFLSILLLASAVILSLMKGLDYEEASLLSLLLIALAPSRKFFYRKTLLLEHPLSPNWTAAILLALLVTAWVMTFSFRHVPYSHELWLTFALKEQASRTLRATTGAVALALLALAALLLRRTSRPQTPPSPVDLTAAEEVARRNPDTTAWLALLGDKRLLFNESRTAFVMFGREGRSFVALGDPAGPEMEGEELAWQFHEFVDRHAGWTVFYEVGRERLPLYIDLGLTLVKLGEQARVPLESFSLSGKGRKGLRGGVNRAEREGCRFEVIGPAEVPPLMEELRLISDAWMAEKRTREKGFSLGYFHPDYLSRCPLALVRLDGRIVAFTNLLQGGGKEELSSDLMRYLPVAPSGVMDFLFAELMSWGRAEGYRFFNLGMAPLSGLPQHALAPLWGRAGSLLFRHGEHFYNFQGVRDFKDKFDPVWEPRYLAAPGRVALPLVLANVATLLSRGWKGVVTK